MPVKWYCAQTHPFGELQAEKELRKIGFQPFSPRCEVAKIIKGREVITRRPWLSGYIFVPFDIEDDPNWPRINNQPGIKRLMPAWTERPTPVRGDAMQVLLDQCNGQVVKAQTVDRAIAKVLWPGALVKASDGPFAGFNGIVEWTDKDRAKVLMHIFGRTTPVEFERKQLEIIS